MRTALTHFWNRDAGLLTFEWILLITLIIIGVIGGMSAVRDGVIDELGDVAGAVINVDQSWTMEAPDCRPHGCDRSYTDPGPNKIRRGPPAEPAISQ